MAILAGLLALPAASWAAEELRDFKPPAEMTPEELEASKAKSRLPVNAYSKQITDQVTPVPWKTIGLFTAILLLVTPYALKYYRATAGESAPAKKSPSPPVRSPSRAAAAAANDDTRVRNVNTVEPDTRVPIRRNTRS
jgi:hypothetical protein